MAVPRYESEVSPSGGPLRIQAQPDLGVSAGLGAVGRGMQDAAQAGAYMYNRHQEEKAVRQGIDDERWAQEQFMKEKLKLAEMLAKDGMNTSEDIVNQVGSFAETQMSQYSNDMAPSANAMARFKDKYAKHVNDVQVASAQVEATNKVNNGVQSIKNNTQTAIIAFRTLSKFSEPLAMANLVDSVASQNASIHTMFGKHFPKLAHQLQENLTTQAVLAAAEVNPEAAATILKNAASIDEQTRAQLTNQIESAQKSSDSAARYRLEAERKDVMTLALAGTVQNGLPLDSYLRVYPKATAKELKRQDDEEIDAYAQANMVADAVATFNKDTQDRAVANLKDESKWTGANSALRAEVADKKVKALQDFARDDIRGYLDTHNKVVIQARGNAITPETTEAYYDTILSQQGPAPTDKKTGALLVSEQEASMHWNMPVNDRHLLGKESAKELAARINLSTPQEVIKTISAILAPYTKDKHKNVVLNDLVTMGKLSQQYQLVWQNKDAWWIGTYIGALKAGKDIKVPDTVRTDIEKRLAIHPNWTAFQSSMIGDNLQRAGEIGGFFEGISQFAAIMYATQGKSAKDAVAEASKRLINETLGFTRINEKPLMILKDRGPGLPKRTQQEIDDIGRRLAFVPQFIPLDEVNQDNWVALTPDMSPDARLEALSDELSARSFWQTSQDGQGAVLYAIDEDGLQQFEVRDKNDKPFVVRFDNLPAFAPIRESQQFVSTSGALGPTLPTMRVPGTMSIGGEAAKHPGVLQSNKQGRPQWLGIE